MSSLVFPTLAGQAFPITRAPSWRTGVKDALSGKEARIQYRRYPRIRWAFKYEVLRDEVSPSEAKAIVGLFNAMQAQYDTFLYSDPEFNSVTTENFGTGDGTTTAFQLIAAYQNAGGPGYAERIQNLNGAPSIFKNGVLQTGGGVNYTLGATGIVTFTSAPAAAQPLTWTGSFYYRARFTEDELVPVKFMNKWWELPTEFISVPL